MHKKWLYISIVVIGVGIVSAILLFTFIPGKTISVEDSLRRHIQTDPHDMGSYLKLLDIYIEKGEREKARKLALSLVKSLNDLEATTLKRLVDISLSTKDASSLAIYLPELLAFNPSKNYYDIYFNMLRDRKKMSRTVIPLYADYISRYPTDTGRIKEYERLLTNFGFYKDVKDVYEKYHDTVGNDVEFEYLAFRSLKIQGEYAKARSIAKLLLDSVYRKEALHFLIEDAKRSGENGKLMSYYEEYLSREFDPKIATEYVDLCISIGKDFLSIIKNIQDARYFKSLSIHLKKKGDIADAIDIIKLALSRDPKDTESRLELSALLLDIGDIKDARNYAVDILKADDNNSIAHLILARCYLQLDEYENAFMEIEKIPKERRTADVFYYLGIIDVKRGNYDEALKAFVTSYNMHPSLNSGKMLLSAARLKNDEGSFRKYLKIISTRYPMESKIGEWKERLSILDEYVSEKKAVKQVVKYGERVWYYLEVQFPNAKPIRLMRLVKETEFLNPFLYDVDHILPGDHIYIPVE